MLVVDTERSERDPQRRKSTTGRLLHCCCICGKLEPWGSTWSGYYSIKDIDDCVPIPKCCSDPCRDRAGPEARNVTEEMKATARAGEMREPNIVYREATPAEVAAANYNRAIDDQRRRARIGERIRQSRHDDGKGQGA